MITLHKDGTVEFSTVDEFLEFQSKSKLKTVALTEIKYKGTILVRIQSYLKENGPSRLREIAEGIGGKPNSVSKLLRDVAYKENSLWVLSKQS